METTFTPKRGENMAVIEAEITKSEQPIVHLTHDEWDSVVASLLTVVCRIPARQEKLEPIANKIVDQIYVHDLQMKSK